ncbi:MAG: hypothetical protein IJE81_04585 [Oscillospiraceae bacterium]|nr:hypothetical protein [Oscillospiraceae bacterium]MBQ7130360.1 hypothetical protein [Oscillospiraceae bacterium]
MKTMFSMNTASSSCCSSAVAGTSAHNIPILDTAPVLAVSICVLGLSLLRIILPIA